MCVLIFKKAGVKMPNDMVLDSCRRANPHGFGFCTPTKYFRSLYYSEFKRELDMVSEKEPCIIHFRLATEGSIKTSNCHPFKSGEGSDRVFFAHNGCLPFHPDSDITDSQYAFENILMPQIEKHGLRSKQLKDAVDRIIGGSKFAFMQGNKVSLFGDFTEYDGCYFSNMRFMYYMKTYHHRLAM